MTNYLREWADGYLEDEPMIPYEKLRSHRHKDTNDKEQTVQRKNDRTERLRIIDGWVYRETNTR
jgi:hypothetical protein